MRVCSLGLIMPDQCPSRILKPSFENAPARSRAALRASTSLSLSAAIDVTTRPDADKIDKRKIDNPEIIGTREDFQTRIFILRRFCFEFLPSVCQPLR